MELDPSVPVALPPANPPEGLRAPLHPAVRGRWSPRAFDDRSVTCAALRSVLEAARWAPSAMNEQPWRFAVARREDGPAYEALLSCLNEANRRWAARAPVLMVVFAKRTYTKTGRPNAHAWHDVGGAVAGMAIQASALGLQLHQMGGILPERIAEVVGAPDDFEPVEGVALGYPGDPDALPDDLAARERAPRRRMDPEALFFGDRWGAPAAVLAAS